MYIYIYIYVYIYIYAPEPLTHQAPDVVDELRKAQEIWTLPVSEVKDDINTVQFLAQTDRFVS